MELTDASTLDADLDQHAGVIETLESELEFELFEGSIKGAMKVHNGSSSDLWKVPPAAIRLIPGFQPKVKNPSYMATVRELADSMKAIGWLTNSALAGYTAKDPETGELIIYLVDGHTRLLAVEIANTEGAKIETVPIIIRTKGVSMDDLNVQLIRGHTGRGLMPYEQGVVCKRLSCAGHSDESIQSMTGIKPGWYNKLMLLMAAPNRLRLMVAYETVAATLAIELIEEHGGAKALKLLEDAKQKIAGPNATPEQAAATKVSRKSIPKTATQKEAAAVKRQAPTLHILVKEVKEDPGYVSLSQDLRTKLEDLLSKLTLAAEDPETAKDDPVDPAPAPQQALFVEEQTQSTAPGA